MNHAERERQVAVIPDAWLQLTVGKEAPVSIALEVDRATEDRKRWQAKVAALSYFALGPYQETFQADNLTIAVVTPGSERRDALRAWTAQELVSCHLAELMDIFLFTDASPLTLTPTAFFFSPCWYPPGPGAGMSLLDPPTPVE